MNNEPTNQDLHDAQFLNLAHTLGISLKNETNNFLGLTKEQWTEWYNLDNNLNGGVFLGDCLKKGLSFSPNIQLVVWDNLGVRIKHKFTRDVFEKTGIMYSLSVGSSLYKTLVKHQIVLKGDTHV